MGSSLFITLLCVLIPSAYTQEIFAYTAIKTSKFGPLKPPECGVRNITSSRIIGGEKAALGAWPWMTALGYESGDPAKPKWQCGGSLISKQHVVTAAHCLVEGLYLVRIGDLDLEDDNDGAKPFQDYIDVSNMRRHPNYDPYNDPSHQNDIAILKTNKEVPFSSILHPICLPVDDKNRYRNLENLEATVAGWGLTAWGVEESKSHELLQAQVPIKTEQQCKQSYQTSVIDYRVVCAGALGKSTCKYDSGGPLMITGVDNPKVFYVIGITSWAYKCALGTHPGVFTRVISFLDYITESMSN